MKAAEQKQIIPTIDSIIDQQQHYKGKLHADYTALAEPFIRHFYTNVMEESIVGATAEQSFAASIAMLDFAYQKESSQRKIRIYNPKDSQYHWETEQTVLELVNPDKPFIVDSVIEAINQLGLNIKSITHPVFSIERDQSGKITSLDVEQQNAKNNESLIQIQFDRMVDAVLQGKITDTINETLDMVDLAVSDWKHMVERNQMLHSQIQQPQYKDLPHIEEFQHFLAWLQDKNFIYLGFREYDFLDNNGTIQINEKESLGIFRSASKEHCPFGPKVGHAGEKNNQTIRDLVEITKSDRQSVVHRPASMDYIIIKKINKEGKQIGEYRFVGLFTSIVYYQSANSIPIIRDKIRIVMKRSKLTTNGYSGKALASTLESFPRDELFQIRTDDLFNVCQGILALSISRKSRIFIREDLYKRFLSCMVFVPKTIYSTKTREKIEILLQSRLNGKVADHYTLVSESPMARVNIIVKLKDNQEFPSYNVEEIEHSIEEIVTSWQDKLLKELQLRFDQDDVERLYYSYANAFSVSYVDRFSAYNARWDIQLIEDTIKQQRIKFDLYEATEEKDILQLKIFNIDTQLSLSDMMPILENMGLQIIDEHTYQCHPRKYDINIWIHHFRLKTMSHQPKVQLQEIKENFESAMYGVWKDYLENDCFNQLVVHAKLHWRDVIMLRAYAKFLRQIRFTYTQDAIEETTADYPEITALIVKLFHIRFDPNKETDRARNEKDIVEEIRSKLLSVSDVTSDRILRRYVDLIQATARTNFFQHNAKGKYKHYISFKFISSNLAELPLPVPYAEIFVYSTHIEGTHLRGGKVARGGLRWSDRKEDFRTEVLGLMKAQMTKNTVIVPVGSKGGFVVKNPPNTGNRQDVMDEAKSCYKTFLRGLLDITDNVIDATITPPTEVVRHDGDDPYLVVAADKGTATFSDIANSISEEYQFWLGDAFASGGSAGYDHKKMGITAKGAWVSVQRHFREMGKDIQREDFTVAGIGDMGGDVFGNGMLLSEHICLVAAFNHLHIFLDPTPDASSSFKERQRLFAMPQSSWEDYDKKLISKGGGIFSRKDKKIPISKEIQQALDIEQDEMTSEALIQAILKAPVDLLWNGGIGTYVKAEKETNGDVGDRANDLLRINGQDLRCKVIGEGGNLGVTQLGRIEFAEHGGRINTDFIDNSAGVDCSDKEVNIKIALKNAIENKRLKLDDRNILLEKMTDNVSDLVLYDNVCQAQAITIQEQQGYKLIDSQRRLLQRLERHGLLNREVEHLPDDESLSARLADQAGLSRPEIAVIFSYAKLDLYEKILKSALPDEAYFTENLKLYFPKAMQEQYEQEILDHPLRREIVSTIITNSMINRVGSTFAHATVEDTGFKTCDVARAYVMARDSFELQHLWREVEALDETVPVHAQVELFLEIQKLIERVSMWFLRNHSHPLHIQDAIDIYRPGIQELSSCVESMLPKFSLKANNEKYQRYVNANIPEKLAKTVSMLDSLASACDIVKVASQDKLPLDIVGKIYFEIGALLDLGWIRRKIAELPRDNYWDKLSTGALIEDTFAEQMRLTAKVTATRCQDQDVCLDAYQQWVKDNQKDLERYQSFISDLRTSDAVDFNMLMIATKRAESICSFDDE